MSDADLRALERAVLSAPDDFILRLRLAGARARAGIFDTGLPHAMTVSSELACTTTSTTPVLMTGMSLVLPESMPAGVFFAILSTEVALHGGGRREAGPPDASRGSFWRTGFGISPAGATEVAAPRDQWTAQVLRIGVGSSVHQPRTTADAHFLTHNLPMPLVCMAHLELGPGDVVQAGWSVTSGTGTARRRTLALVRLGGMS